MKLGKVVGTVVSTSKSERLTGSKLLLVREIDEHLELTDSTEIAVDMVGAGTGEIVFLCKGSAAQKAFHIENAPVDAVIAGIVDTVECPL